MRVARYKHIWGNGRRSWVTRLMKQRQQHKTKLVITAGGRSNLHIYQVYSSALFLDPGCFTTSRVLYS